MTVNSTHSVSPYVADGDQTEFTFDFKVYDEEDINVYYDYSSTPVDNSLYTIDIDTDFNGGTVTFNTAPAVGTIIEINREIDLTQKTRYPVAGPFPAEAHEKALDKLTMILQQQQRMIQDGVGFSPITGEWATGINYKRNQFAYFDTGEIYLCKVDHTSDVFSTDFASGYWTLLMDAADTYSTGEAASYATAASNSADAAAISASNAAASEDTCAAYVTQAANIVNMGSYSGTDMTSLAAKTLDTSTYDTFDLYNIDTNFTITLSNMTAGRTIVVFLRGGNNTITWPTGIYWPNGEVPEISTDIDVVTLTMIGGSAIVGSWMTELATV